MQAFYTVTLNHEMSYFFCWRKAFLPSLIVSQVQLGENALCHRIGQYHRKNEQELVRSYAFFSGLYEL